MTPRLVLGSLVAATLIGAALPPSADAQRAIGNDSDAYRGTLTRGGSRGATVSGGPGTEALRDFDEGRLDVAERKTDDEIAAAQKVPDRFRVAALTDFRGLIKLRRGNPRLAIMDFSDARIALGDPTAGRQLTAKLNVLNNLGMAHYLFGEYENALTALRTVTSATILPDDPGQRRALARALNNRGLVEDELGRDGDAIRSFGEAIKAVTVRDVDDMDEDKIIRAQSMNNLARLIARAQLPFVDTRKALTDARALAKAAKLPILEADILDSLAEVLLHAADTAPDAQKKTLAKDALDRLDEARKVLGSVHAPVLGSTIAVNRARAMAAQGRPRADVDAAFTHALTATRPVVAVRARMRDFLGARADWFRATRRFDDAIADYVAAIDLAEDTIGRSLSDNQRAKLASLQRLYQGLVEVYAAKGLKAEAQKTAMRSVSASLAAEMRQRHPEFADPDTQRRAEDHYNALAREDQLVTQIDGAPAADRARLQRELGEVRKNAQAALAALKTKLGDSEYAVAFGVNPISFNDLAKTLPPGRVIVSYFATAENLFIFTASRGDGLQWRTVKNVTVDTLDQDVQAYRRLVTTAPGDAVEDWSADHVRTLRELTTRLYGQLLAPIEPMWKSAEHLIVAPSGPLHYLPFQALGPYNAATKQIEHVIATKRVSYFTPVNHTTIAVGPQKPRFNTMLALGNPVYQHHPPLASLDFAETEVNEIKKLAAGRVVAYPGSKATLANLQAELKTPTFAAAAQRSGGDGGPTKFGILHLATHGILDRRHSGEAWLAMDGTNRLKAVDVGKLDLSAAHLVTLSACSTAVEKVNPGAEVMSLATYFHAAGSPSVVASLWNVNDRATGLLMVEFYKHLFAQPAGSMDKAAALQAAQVSLMKDPLTRHPFYWAPFGLFGDWR